MGGPSTKQSSTGTTTNTYGQISPLDDPRYAEAVAKMGGFQFKNDPRTPYVYGNARNKIAETYQNPLGGYGTAQTRDAGLRSSTRALAQDESQAYREENHGMQGLKYAQLADTAQMSAPRTVQTGGTSTQSGTSQTNPGVFNQVAQGASLALLAF